MGPSQRPAHREAATRTRRVRLGTRFEHVENAMVWRSPGRLTQMVRSDRLRERFRPDSERGDPGAPRGPNPLSFGWFSGVFLLDFLMIFKVVGKKQKVVKHFWYFY